MVKFVFELVCLNIPRNHELLIVAYVLSLANTLTSRKTNSLASPTPSATGV
jgi:hypothetical protein